MTTMEEQVEKAGPIKTPDLYQLHGKQLHISYSTTGVAGKPRFDYQDAVQSLTFEGDDIRTVDTEIGTLVTVTIRRTIDTGATSFSLLVPAVNLGSANVVPIHTEGITTIHRFSVIPLFSQGQAELYSVTPLTGTASFVVF